ncbi:hypothetical protein WN51_09426 [Melipona quadrifasciata]|uniref:Uncharacterized protein n=1 Tax=Melipona quadrifasciata TaxID=166423 RepID=A0A0N0U2L4_9HYME|nr:hypothetical protein WN51_09426 [Melipona quadrifasciata]
MASKKEKKKTKSLGRLVLNVSFRRKFVFGIAIADNYLVFTSDQRHEITAIPVAEQLRFSIHTIVESSYFVTSEIVRDSFDRFGSKLEICQKDFARRRIVSRSRGVSDETSNTSLSSTVEYPDDDDVIAILFSTIYRVSHLKTDIDDIPPTPTFYRYDCVHTCVLRIIHHFANTRSKWVSWFAFELGGKSQRVVSLLYFGSAIIAGSADAATLSYVYISRKMAAFLFCASH